MTVRREAGAKVMAARDRVGEAYGEGSLERVCEHVEDGRYGDAARECELRRQTAVDESDAEFWRCVQRAVSPAGTFEDEGTTSDALAEALGAMAGRLTYPKSTLALLPRHLQARVLIERLEAAQEGRRRARGAR